MESAKQLVPVTAVWIILSGTPAAAQTGQPENTPQACQDGVDNDLDGLTDCADQDCEPLIFCDQEAPSEVPPEAVAPRITAENTVELCGDQRDNDSDGLADCNDPDCKIFAVCAAPAPATTPTPPPAPKAPPKEPHVSKYGIGIYGSLVVFGRGSSEIDYKGTPLDPKQQSKMKVNGGLGIFGEYILKPFVALGGEIYLAFPKVDEGRVYNPEYHVWLEWNGCNTCETSVFFNVLFRVKFIIRAGKWLGIYPIIGFGLSNYTDRLEDENSEHYLGLAYSAGLGLEGRTPTIVTPFFEFRYYGSAGWWVSMSNAEEEFVNWQQVLYNSLSLNFGIRFL
jgi:hypothetical protein